jgi:hypothetical protein
MTILQSAIAQSAAGGGYQISRSLRFNIADSAYLNRTPASNGNRRTWTFSAWVKRSSLGALQTLLSAPYSINSDAIRFESADTLIIFSNDGNNCNLTTTQVFRDVSSWYHIVVAVDTPQATSTNRVKLYVNGAQVTAFGTATYPTQNYEFNINANVAQNIGRNSLTASQYLGGYMTEINFIDGQALTPSSFGETSATTGVWNPIDYTGTYGTNGFYLNFSDNSNTTAATLGADTSGNGNNWTPNNFSVTAGVGNDSLVDSPTNYGTDTGAGGEVRGNYATLNPLKLFASNFTISNGNLDATDSGASNISAIATMATPTSGKWYFEATAIAQPSSGAISVGLLDEANAISSTSNLTIGSYRSNGAIYNIATTAQTSGATYVANDVIGIAIDADAGTVKFYKNGTGQGATPSFSFTAGIALYPYIAGDNISGAKSWSMNFGQRPFAYTAPSGFKALCTQNLPTPAIGATSSTLANKNFDATLYTGTGASLSVANAGSFQPDFVWVKSRSNAQDNKLTDVLRGVTKGLVSNTTAAETTDTNGLTTFNSGGFTVGSDATYNTNAATYVGWQWKGANTTVSNTSGTITSTVSANPTAGISVIGWTSTGSNGTIGHGLGVAPAFIIARRTNTIENWLVYHKNMGGNNGYLLLNSTAAFATNVAPWNSTNPTSSVISINNNAMGAGTSNPMITYAFAEVAGFSKFGSYVGNGTQGAGPFVYTGFRPRYVVVKKTSPSGTNWTGYDTARSPYNYSGSNVLKPDSSAAELTARNDVQIDILSNGFRLIGNDIAINENGSTFIYMAFAESPFNYSRAR